MTQKTAVEFLINHVLENFQPTDYTIMVVFEQAKQMEKEQIKECWNTAHQAGRFEGKGIAEENWQTFEQYYNETYGE